MKIFVDKNNIICAVDSCARTDVTQYEVDESVLIDKCKEFIYGYKFEPTYQLEYDVETGEVKIDDNGNPIYLTDANGNKILSAYCCYPYMDYVQMLLNKSNEKTESLEKYSNDIAQQNDELVLMIADVIGGVN